MAEADTHLRTFKSKWFTKAARKAGIEDEELCETVEQARLGQASDLGGGVWKKRLDRNRHRSTILVDAGQLWVYEYLFAKKERDNIDEAELEAFRKLAKGYAALNAAQLRQLLDDKDLTEICDGEKA